MMLEERTLSGLHVALLSCVQTLAGVEPDSAILDLACGTGAWLKRLYGAGYRKLVGIDRDVAGFGASDIATFIPLDLDADNAIDRIATSKFALVTMIEVIEHVANPQYLVDIAFRALIPAGWMLITSPNIYSLRARVRFLLRGGIPYFEESASRTPIERDHIHPIILEAFQRKIFDPLGLSPARIWTYPQTGSSGSRCHARLATRILRLAFADNLSGDILCLLLRKPTDVDTLTL